MRKAILVLVGVLVSVSGLAQASDIPVHNWTVPAYRVASSDGELTTMTDVTGPRAFTAVQPCRIVDTRSGSFPAGFGPPALSPGVLRVFDLNDGPCPGLPVFLDAYSLNVTVVTPAGPGHLIIWPTGSPEPAVSSINYSGQTIANAVIVPSGSSEAISVKAGVSGTHVLIDINGYFSNITTSNQTFQVRNNLNSAVTAWFVNDSTACGGDCAVVAASGTLTTGKAMTGEVSQGGNDSAGVFGRHRGFGGNSFGYSGAGVRGQGEGYGVLGISGVEGVAGSLVSGSFEVAYGSLGLAAGTDPSGGGGGPWGVFAGGNIGATGTKHFLDPHPTDPSLSIAYISLEGPEAGTYFRGRGRFQNGTARIAVPEHFRFVTDPEGLTVQITPIGGMATVGVVRMDLNEIVVQSSRNLEFSYLVQGVRSTFKDLQPLRASGEFRPRNADARIPGWLSAGQKRLLIQNGTYREDGSVNVETARRLGWDRIWDARERPAPALNPE